MTQRPERTELRLSRVENDAAAIYELLTDVFGVQSKHGSDLAAIRATLAEHGAALAEHGVALAEHGVELVGVRETLARHDVELSAVRSTLVAMQATLAEHETRFDGIDEGLAEILRRLPEAS